MPDFGRYIDWQATGDLEEWYREFDRADSVAFMLGHRGVELTLVRGSQTLDAQTLLLTPMSATTFGVETKAQSGVGARNNQFLLVGQTDADIQRGDMFMYPSTEGRLNYKVIRVEKELVGMLQAVAEEVQ